MASHTMLCRRFLDINLRTRGLWHKRIVFKRNIDINNANMSETKEETKPKKPYVDGKDVPNVWLVRPCESYKDEHAECVSIKGRFHQYFIHGENSDCTRWQIDYENCMKYRLRNDIPALEAVIQSESKRRYERLAPHYCNDVWKHRDSPPEDWNKPLPQKMQEDYRNTYLDHKAREYKATQT